MGMFADGEGRRLRWRMETVKEEAREARPTRVMENLSRDVHLAFRQLRRSRGFAISAAALLAVGIGGTVAVFSVLDAIHFRPLPYPNANRLVTIQVRMSDPRCGNRCLRDPDSDEVEAFRANVSAVEKLGTIAVAQGAVMLPSGARIMKGAAVFRTDFRAARVARCAGTGPGAGRFSCGRSWRTAVEPQYMAV